MSNNIRGVYVYKTYKIICCDCRKIILCDFNNLFQNSQRAFTFDPKNIVMSTRRPLERVSNRSHQMYMSQPHIRLNNAEFSENDSNLSDEECKSLNASHSNISMSHYIHYFNCFFYMSFYFDFHN